MKSVFIVCLFGLVALAASRYTDKYDNIDLQEILDNRRVLESYVLCLLDKGKCVPEALYLKEHVAEALGNHCEECTETQVTGAKRIIKHFINKEPEMWDQLCEKFDPKKIHASEYEKELREITTS